MLLQLLAILIQPMVFPVQELGNGFTECLILHPDGRSRLRWHKPPADLVLALGP